jgi:hypothetical protein
MSWLRIDDKMWRNPKVRAAMCLCAEWETDGYVTKAMAKEIGATKTALKELENVQIPGKKPLWIRSESGWQINDYLDYNPSRADLAEQKENRRTKAKKAAEARWGSTASEDANGNATSIATSMGHVDAPSPSPQPQASSLSSLDQPTLSSEPARDAPLADQIRIHAKDINPEARYEIERLAAVLTDRDQGTIGRLVALARRGATARHFADARQGITTSTTNGSPSKKACKTIENALTAELAS